MSGGQSQSSRLAGSYNSGYSAYTPGVDPTSDSSRDWRESNFNNAYLSGWESADKAYQTQLQQASFFEGLMSQQSSGPSYEEQMAKQQEEYDRRQEEQRIAQGKADRDTAYSNYMTAASSAADYVKGEIGKEASNARLLGIDYTTTPEQQAGRINDYFATLWGEGDQTQLDALMKEYGNPKGFEGFSVTRGDGSKYAGTAASETTIATSKGTKPRSTLVTDEDTTLGNAGALGA